MIHPPDTGSSVRPDSMNNDAILSLASGR
uniref:Uncharacterized protein n=1 Tax=Rhizophora mucronata TaxID=61149 RepID=A0A2P2PTV6_RHIMU